MQLDIFADQRLAEGLTCLHDAVCDVMHIVVHLGPWWEREDRGPRANGDWAYAIRNAGFRFERRDVWSAGGGWSRTPAHSMTWDELAELIGDDPRRPAIIEWFNSLTEPDRWLDQSRPHELFADVKGLHPSWAEGDHERPGWEARLAAWRDVLGILVDARARIDGHAEGGDRRG